MRPVGGVGRKDSASQSIITTPRFSLIELRDLMSDRRRTGNYVAHTPSSSDVNSL